MTRCQLLWQTDSLPFYWGQQPTATNGPDLPDTLPFALCVHPQTGVLMQASNPQVTEALTRAYARGSSITGMMDDSGIGREYAEDFLNFLSNHTDTLRGKRVLEIGCGTGYLLSRLKPYGAEVLGVEPGEHGQEGASKYGVPIIHDYFPSAKIDGKFDIIIVYAVLEHMEDPLQFMRGVKEALAPGGAIFFSVPDTEPCQRQGDASVLLHEHWSYFTRHSLETFLQVLGGSSSQIEAAGFGGALYGKVSGFEAGSSHAVTEAVKDELGELFTASMDVLNSKIAGLFASAREQGQSIAVYVPIRIINALTITEVQTGEVRFIDDNTALHGTYCPGFGQVVEGRKSLEKSPTDIVLVMSHTFGNKIKAELQGVLPASTKIIAIADL